MLTAAATYARDNLSLPWDKVRARCTAPHSLVRQTRGVVAASESLGGYLLTQACALVDPGLVQGCIADPASPNMGFAVAYTALGPLVAPFAAVNASLLAALCPSCAQYGAAYWTVNATYAPVQVRSRCTHPISLWTSSHYLLTVHTVGIQPRPPDERSVGAELHPRPGRLRQVLLLRRHRRPRGARARRIRLAHPHHGAPPRRTHLAHFPRCRPVRRRTATPARWACSSTSAPTWWRGAPSPR